MGKTGYSKCIEFMKLLKSKEYVKEISRQTLIDYIKMFFGDDYRTFQKYMDNLRTYGFIEKIDHTKFKIKPAYKELY